MDSINFFLHTAGATQSLFFALYFWLKRKQPGFTYLALLMLLLTFLILLGYVYTSGRIIDLPHLSRTGFPTAALIGPLMYFFLKTLFNPGFSIKRQHMLFFLIPAGELVYLLPYYLGPVSMKLQYIQEDLQNIHIECTYMSLFTYISMLSFLLLGVFDIIKVYPNKKERFNKEHKKEIIVLYSFLTLIIGYNIFIVLGIILDPNYINSNLFSGSIAVLVLITGYISLFISNKAGLTGLPGLFNKYDKSRLPDVVVDGKIKNLLDHFENNQVFLDPDLNLKKISELLNISSNNVSQIINRHFNMSFPDLLNKYRVDYAIKLLSNIENSEKNILHIAFESGFNSKSNFNSTFKKLTGQNPGAYRLQFKKNT